jgi:hypothetical protein
VAGFVIIDIWFCTLAWKWVVTFGLSRHHDNLFSLKLAILTLRQLGHQTWYHVVNNKIIHQHRLHGDNQIFIWCRQTLEQCHDNILFLTGTNKQTNWTTSTLTLLTWYSKSSFSCTLEVTNLRWMRRILGTLFVSWMLQMVFHTYAGPLQLLMCASWLSAKLKPKISMGF